MVNISQTGPGAIRLAAASRANAIGLGREDDPDPRSEPQAHTPIRLNADRRPDERISLVILNTGDRPIQIGSHIHLPDVNSALDFDRDAAHGFRLDIPSGTSRRFEPGASRRVEAVAFRGARRIPGIQLKSPAAADLDG